ncbi:putative DNA-binding transcriptional regulator YafY [Microbacterium sp. SORGH_AS428]|uniref:helix-turn-helix transcriptional regulator n=1 Tax=Microbacterium sp. SORGH_AS_0428 TaxID=3041788 RepID=UPI002860E9D8|nr:WYL domain-containing protein [Microbacterium sp. SORGH_AS_0428]MDR6199989.1 putative DNA-binding transcriptional regulator YafY [Microbacterium sp. SORGH_AS_0428]
MNRTDRLYSLVEELRAVAPRPRSASWLAARFEVSVRTIERDISALQQSGVPIWAEPGRTGGYCVSREHTLPPVNFTPQEAMAMAVALRSMGAAPFRLAAETAMRKLVFAMRGDDAQSAKRLATRVHFLRGDADAGPVPRVLADTLADPRVLRIGYEDRAGVRTEREIEPLGYVASSGAWFLIAWCRLRDGIRAFRTDRIREVVVTAEVPEERVLTADDIEIVYGTLDPLTL